MRIPNFLAVDFFCGAGGTTCGLIEAGGYVIAGVDRDLRCRQTYLENNKNRCLDRANPQFLPFDIFPRRKSYPAGEQHLLTAELQRLISAFKAKAPQVPMLFAICAPCQPFTTLSKKELSEARRAGRKRDKNLLSEATKFVDLFRPELILSENVSGIRDRRFGGVWDDFARALESLGYVTGTSTVCASDFGVPQYRRRSILLAVRKDYANYGSLGITLAVPQSDPEARHISVREAIDHLPKIGAGEAHAMIPNHRTRTLSDLNLKRLAAAKPGESNAYMSKTRFGDLSLKCHRKVNRRLRVRCFTDVYTRMSPNRPSPTITTRCHSISNGRFGHYDTRQLRGISLREAAILQSFPEDYTFYPTEQIEPVARMIGNAVPPKLACFFAAHLVESFARPASSPK